MAGMSGMQLMLLQALGLKPETMAEVVARLENALAKIDQIPTIADRLESIERKLDRGFAANSDGIVDPDRPDTAVVNGADTGRIAAD